MANLARKTTLYGWILLLMARAAWGSADPVASLPADHPLRLISAEPDPAYKEMLGLRRNGWLGSDDGESIVLSPTKTLWLFGDTFIGPLTNGMRQAGAPMINSTIGIQDRTATPPDCLTFYWKTNQGRPASFFPHQSTTPGDYYWVTKGILLEHELFLWAWSIKGGAAQGLFNWTIAGSTLFRIPNPQDPPEQWVQQARPIELPPDFSFHSALCRQGQYLYLYGIVSPPRQTAVARMRVRDLVHGKLAEAYEYWTHGPHGNEWSHTPTNCVPQFLPVNSECTVVYHPEWKLYTCFTYDVLSDQILLTTARQATGPWTAPAVVYRAPECHRFHFSVMAYAVREHPELSRHPGEIILTYATNTLDSEKELFTPEGSQIYVHRFVRLALAANPGP